MNSEQKLRIDYVENTLAFYFRGGFAVAVTSGGIDDEELNTWFEIATVFEHALDPHTEYSEVEKSEILDLVEDAVTTAQVSFMFGESFDSSEIGAGFDFDVTKYGGCLKKVIALIEARYSVGN